jgi:hypothetical protein
MADPKTALDPKSTLYVDIPEVGGPGRPKTALYFPPAVTRTSPYNLLVYLHGTGMPPVENWLASDARFPLREKVAASGKKLVLVVPSLTGDCHAGKLEKDPDWYLDRVLQEIGAADGGPAATIGKLVIAAHSGGGIRMFEMTTGMVKYKSTLAECWGFDCLYQPIGDPKRYTIPKGRVWPPNPHPLLGEIEYKWATSLIRFYVHYLLAGSTAIRSENLDNLNYDIPYCRAIVQSTRQPHHLIPREYIGERLDHMQL